jgi:hypothetical protein
MSTAAAKTPASGTPRRDAASKNAASSPGAANRTPARNSTPTTNGTGVARTRSVRSGANGAPVSARAAVRKPAAPSTLSSGASQADTSDEEAKEEQAAYLHELKERLQKAETEAEERQKVVEVLNARLDEALLEQAKLEERAHEEEEKVESLENVKREITRQHRELEGIYEAERVQAMKDKEETQTREEELQETIQRLKEAMASKNGNSEGEEDHVSRACKSSSGLMLLVESSLIMYSELPQKPLSHQLLAEPRSRWILRPTFLRPPQRFTKQLEAHQSEGQDYRGSPPRACRISS